MSAGTINEAVVWQDVECGDYTADLSLWEQMAGDTGGPILELGCGNGRVALHLARLGHSIWGIDAGPAQVEELRRRATAEQIGVRAENADAAGFELGELFGLILAPMQVIQLLEGRSGRHRCLAAVAAHLRPDGLAAIAIAEAPVAGIPPAPPIPDVRELDGWIYSSMPLGVVEDGEALVIERLRQRVSPDGRLTEARDRVNLSKLTAAGLEREAREAGLHPAGRHTIEASELHAASTVVVLGV